MTAKLSPKAALACNLLVFNALVAFLFIIWMPFSLVFYILLGIFKSFFDFIHPWIVENKEIVLAYKNRIKNENNKNHAHVMAPIPAEDVRKN